MGWSKGKGLGANLNGTQDFIRVRYKNDIGGLGFSARDDQWTENEFTFNSLLKNLNGENGKEEESKEEAVNKIKSLEEKSKKSRSRVHYQKFTRGKDLSRYSEKDLANIFGKKSLNESYKVEKEDESSSDSVAEVAETVEDSKMINTGVSIVDYFKSKRQNVATKISDDVKNGNENSTTSEELIIDSQQVPKKKKKSNKKKLNDDEHVETTPTLDEKEATAAQDEVIKDFETIPAASDKKKKSKKKKNKEESEQVDFVQDNVEADQLTTKKKKKHKTSIDSEEESIPLPDSAVTIEKPTLKLKKRRLSNETDNVIDKQNPKKQRNDEKLSTTTTITVGVDPNKFFLDAVAVEKLKYLRLEKFKDSNVANIVGYGLSKDIQLEVCDSSIVKGISHVNKYSIYANVDKMHSKKYYKSLLLRYHKKRNTFKM